MHKCKIISKKQLQYLSGPEDPRPRRFYILPKIHKDPTTWTVRNKIPTGRPIISDLNSESYRVSDYVNNFINPLACKHPSYIKNSYDFIEKIKRFEIDEDTYMVTGDITALYTNMRHDITINSIKKIFQQYPVPNRPDEHLLKLLALMLENNDFEFNGDIFLQTCGCPMGKIIGPAAANIYLIDFDAAAVSGFRIKPLVFFRFLDDVFLFWKGTLKDLEEYENYLNSLIPGIEIKLQASLLSANFLDITVFKKFCNGKTIVGTKVYVKPTDAQNLLHTSSFHPPHTTRGILKSQLIRYTRISSTWSDYVQAARTLFQSLRTRGYSWSRMWTQLVEVWFDYKTRDYEKTKQDRNESLFPIVINYDKLGKQLGQKYKTVLKNSCIFKDYKPILAYKNYKNLGNVLVHSKVKLIDYATYFVTQCGRKKCKTCKIIHEGPYFRCTNNNRRFRIRENLNCESLNVIYVITCDVCQKQYVGHTTQKLADRVNNHMSCIRTRKHTPVSLHFNLPGHSINNLKICPIERLHLENSGLNKTEITNILHKKEKFWQHNLCTFYPSGINHLNQKYH